MQKTNLILDRLSTRLAKAKDKINASFWFVPSVCIFFSFVILALSLELDRTQLLRNWVLVELIYSIDPQGARSILSVIAGSVITVTSIAFSMIVIALTLASGQFGPRLLRNFIQNKKTQIALGIFVSTFLYSLALIRFVSIDENSPFVPGASLSLALIFTFLCIFTLVFLIHHLAISIQADKVVDECWIGLKNDIHRIYSDDKVSKDNYSTNLKIDARIKAFKYKTRHDGYVQAIDFDYLANTLKTQVIKFKIKPGDYLISGQSIAEIHTCKDTNNVGDKTQSNEKQDKSELDIDAAIIVNYTRTPTQDAEFAIYQLVEIALRALSPGINDPFTAITCINRLGSGLHHISKREPPQQFAFDSSGTAKIEKKVPSFNSLLASSCDQIRQAIAGFPCASIAFLDMLHSLTTSLTDTDHKRALLTQAAMLYEVFSNTDACSEDKNDFERRFQKLKQLSS